MKKVFIKVTIFLALSFAPFSYKKDDDNVDNTPPAAND